MTQQKNMYFNAKYSLLNIDIEDLMVAKIVTETVVEGNWLLEAQGCTPEEMDDKNLRYRSNWFSEEKVILTHEELLELIGNVLNLRLAQNVIDQDDVKGVIERMDMLTKRYVDRDYESEAEANGMREALIDALKVYDFVLALLKNIDKKQYEQAELAYEKCLTKDVILFS